jgi:hypothetical protein
VPVSGGRMDGAGWRTDRLIFIHLLSPISTNSHQPIRNVVIGAVVIVEIHSVVPTNPVGGS